MKSIILRSLTVSMAVAAVIALPNAVKAQAGNLSGTDGISATSSEQVGTKGHICFRIPGFGLRCLPH
jgi:hypothetical protein